MLPSIISHTVQVHAAGLVQQSLRQSTPISSSLSVAPKAMASRSYLCSEAEHGAKSAASHSHSTPIERFINADKRVASIDEIGS